MQAKNVYIDGKYRRRTWNTAGVLLADFTDTAANAFVDELGGIVTSAGKRPKPLVPRRHAYRSYSHALFNGYYRNYYIGKLVSEQVGFLPRGLAEIPESELPSQANIDNQALQNLNAKVRGNLDLSVNLFEIYQTKRMLRGLTREGLADIASGINRYLNKVRKRLDNGDHPMSWQEVLKFPADVWLQFTYGLKPLVLDTYGAIDEMNRYVNNRLEHYEASAVVVLPKRIKGGSAMQNNPVGWFEPVNGKRLTKYGLTLDAGLLEERRVARWTSLNPVSIAWELMPYSFVIDWFVDVGTFLRETETALINNVAFVNGYMTQLTAYDAKASLIGYYKSDNYTAHEYAASGWVKYRRLQRTTLGSYPLPNLPRFRYDLGSNRLLSAAALLAQFIKP